MTTWTTVTPLEDEPEQQSYWEPWEPKIGDRVRVRLSGECVDSFWGINDDGVEARGTGHSDAENLLVGSVIECPHIATDGYCSEIDQSRSHVYAVRFDKSYLYGGVRFSGNHYAAIELDPLEEA